MQNITLTALARNRRLLFVEGDEDFRVLRRFARKFGLAELAAGFGITSLASGGFGSWERVTTLAEGIGQALGTQLMIGAVYDRDYFCSEEIDTVAASLSRHLRLAHVHHRKEIENYLLVPDALDRALVRAVADRKARTGGSVGEVPKASDLLRRITDRLRDDVQSQLIGRRTTYLRSTKKDLADLTRETLARFTPQWEDLGQRLSIVPGKEVLRALREEVQVTLGVSLTDARIIDAMRVDEIPDDLAGFLRSLERFRKASA